MKITVEKILEQAVYDNLKEINFNYTGKQITFFATAADIPKATNEPSYPAIEIIGSPFVARYEGAKIGKVSFKLLARVYTGEKDALKLLDMIFSEAIAIMNKAQINEKINPACRCEDVVPTTDVGVAQDAEIEIYEKAVSFDCFMVKGF
jgi:hypothetical protein